MASPISRREAMLAAAAVSAASLPRVLSADTTESVPQKVCVFTKPFNSLSFEQLADEIAELGFDGIEAPVRAGGHVEPVNVERDLPKLVEALKRRGLEITVMTTDINDPEDPLTGNVLRTASELGIRRYRMKYLKYDLRRPVLEQIDAWKSVFNKLAALNEDFGLCGLYQNHAGSNFLGSTLWDLRIVLEDIATDQIGVAYDIRHASVEGGTSWPITFNMIRPKIDTVYVKDFEWFEGKVRNVPLGSGQVSPSFFELLSKSGFNGPISLHEEYLDHREPALVPQHLAAIERDMQTLRKWMQGPAKPAPVKKQP